MTYVDIGVSTYLRVLRQVGLMDVRDEGRERPKRLQARPERFERLDVVLEELKETEEADGGEGE